MIDGLQSKAHSTRPRCSASLISLSHEPRPWNCQLTILGLAW